MRWHLLLDQDSKPPTQTWGSSSSLLWVSPRKPAQTKGMRDTEGTMGTWDVNCRGHLLGVRVTSPGFPEAPILVLLPTPATFTSIFQAGNSQPRGPVPWCEKTWIHLRLRTGVTTQRRPAAPPPGGPDRNAHVCPPRTHAGMFAAAQFRNDPSWKQPRVRPGTEWRNTLCRSHTMDAARL